MDGCNIGELSLARCDLQIRLYHSGSLGIFYSLRKTSVITNFFKKNTRRNELLDISFRILFSENDRSTGKFFAGQRCILEKYSFDEFTHL